MNRNMYVLLLLLGVTIIPAFPRESVAEALVKAPNFQSIQPILEKKCAICHAAEARRPFSSKIPIWNYATGTNIGLARKHYDIDPLMREGNAAGESQMKALEYAILHKTMPPPQYRLFHLGKSISSGERQAILNWIYAGYPDWKAEKN